MCAIFGSFDRTRLKSLRDANTYRGSVNWSLTAIDEGQKDIVTQMGDGVIPDETIDEFFVRYPNRYVLAHTQAPTGAHTDYRTHPACTADGWRLWHNGIIKSGQYPEGMWDTYWLLLELEKAEWNFDALNPILGSFSCVLISPNGELYMFRNMISPMFYDESNADISSTRTEHRFLPTKFNCVYRFMPYGKPILTESILFANSESPYRL